MSEQMQCNHNNCKPRPQYDIFSAPNQNWSETQLSQEHVIVFLETILPCERGGAKSAADFTEEVEV